MLLKKMLGGLFLSIWMAASAFAAVDINTASQAELETVKGIGPAKAKAIVEYREKNGAFKSVDDLANVKGLGKASVAKLKNDLTVAAAKTEDAQKSGKKDSKK
jgi:competence protein ComEA